MHPVQIIFGIAVFMVVVSIAAYVARDEKERISYIGQVAAVTGVVYLVIAVIAGALWVFAWFGIILRDALQWLLESLFWPFWWLF